MTAQSYIPQEAIVFSTSNIVTNDKNKNKVVGFKVDDYEYGVLKKYAHIFYEQMIEDPQTKEHCRLLEKPDIAMLIKNATYAYLMQYQYIMQKQAEEEKQNAIGR